MYSLNEVKLIGNLVRDPESKAIGDSNTVTNITIATSEKWKDKNSGEQQEKSEFTNVVLFGHAARIVNEKCRKGDRLFVSGKLQTRKWQDKEGNDRWTTEVCVSGFEGKFMLLGEAKTAARPEPEQPDLSDEIPF